LVERGRRDSREVDIPGLDVPDKQRAA